MLPRKVPDHAALFLACVLCAWNAPSISDVRLTQLVSLPVGILHCLNLCPDWIPCPSFHSHQVQFWVGIILGNDK